MEIRSVHPRDRAKHPPCPKLLWEIIAPHEAQAKINHDQSLERLAQRGGLSCYEALCVLQDRKLEFKQINEVEYLYKLIEFIKNFFKNDKL